MDRDGSISDEYVSSDEIHHLAGQQLQIHRRSLRINRARSFFRWPRRRCPELDTPTPELPTSAPSNQRLPSCHLSFPQFNKSSLPRGSLLPRHPTGGGFAQSRIACTPSRDPINSAAFQAQRCLLVNARSQRRTSTDEHQVLPFERTERVEPNFADVRSLRTGSATRTSVLFSLCSGVIAFNFFSIHYPPNPEITFERVRLKNNIHLRFKKRTDPNNNNKLVINNR